MSTEAFPTCSRLARFAPNIRPLHRQAIPRTARHVAAKYTRFSKFIHRVLDTVAIFLSAWIVDIPSPWITALVMVIILQVLPDFYRHRLNLSLLNALPTVVPRALIVGFFAYIVVNPHVDARDSFDFIVVSTIGLIVSWALSFAAIRSWRRHAPISLHRTLVLGSADDSVEIVTTLKENPQFGLSPVAIIDLESQAASEKFPEVETDYFSDNLTELLQRHEADVVIVAPNQHSEEFLLSAFRASLRDPTTFYVVPALPLQGQRHDTEELGLISLRPVKRSAYRSVWWLLKRPIDIALSLFAMILLSPLMAVLAVLVKLDSPRNPVLFRQTRIGLDGKPFELLKFRTLTPATVNESDVTWNVSHDDRLTPLNRIMRKFSLDELPQILNVLRGDMTLVGPRPERPHFVEKFGADYPIYHDRHRVPVGLTGWAAINGLRGDTSIKTRAEYDNWYIEHWSIWLDVKILLLTVRAVLKGTGG